MSRGNRALFHGNEHVADIAFNTDDGRKILGRHAHHSRDDRICVHTGLAARNRLLFVKHHAARCLSGFDFLQKLFAVDGSHFHGFFRCKVIFNAFLARIEIFDVARTVLGHASGNQGVGRHFNGLRVSLFLQALLGKKRFQDGRI